MSTDCNDTKSGQACGLLILAGYVLAGFLTFGHIFNQNHVDPVQDCGTKPDVVEQYAAWDQWYWCTHPSYLSTTEGAAPPAIAAGLAWPLYWAGHFAIKVTK